MLLASSSLRGGAVALAIVALGAPRASATRTVDRLYRFGDDPRENAVAGAEVAANSPDAPFAPGESLDSAGALGGQQVVNVAGEFGFGPKYVQVTDRPDGVGGIAVEFDGNGASTFDHLQGQRLGTPESSISSEAQGGTVDYFFILDRGMQFWTKPAALPVENDVHIVMDTNNHGALINTNGRYAMRYNGVDVEGVGDAAIAVADEWAHVMVVRPDRTNPYSVMYVNGVATAAAPGDYLRGIPPLGTVNDIPDSAPLVIGAGTEPASGFSQGFINNYQGVVDDLEMFVLGLGPGGDFGEFDFATDNQYAAAFAPSNPLDLAGNDSLLNMDDVDVFVSNWLFEKSLGGVVLGDLETVALGDFDFSGRVDIADWAILNAANPVLGAAAMAQIRSIPEPAATLLVGVAGVSALAGRRRVAGRGW